MTLETIRGAARGRAIAAGAVVALACSACASKEKIGSGPAGGMSPPPMTAAFDPSRSMASGASGSSLWGGSPSPAEMPTASANDTPFIR